MNLRDYLTKIHTHLQDRNTYKPLTYSPTSAIVIDTCTLIEYIHSQYMIDKATKKLPSKNTHTPLFYGLRKIHKPGFPLYPIVSGCDGSTDHLSGYVTHFIQPLGSNLPSHVKDTKHFSISSKNSHPFHPMPSWSQLMSRPYTQTSHTKKAQQP